MNQPVTQEVILQAILELSAQVKENRDEWKADVATLKSDVTILKEDVASIKEWMVKTDERLETIDAKMDVYTKVFFDMQAEIVKV